MDVHNVLVVAHDKVNGLIRALLETFKRRACSLNNIQIIHNIAAHLAQAHTGAVDAGFRVALHIAARAHAGQQTVLLCRPVSADRPPMLMPLRLRHRVSSKSNARSSD